MRRGLAVANFRLFIERVLRRVARALGFHLVRADYYSPIVDVGELPDALFDRRSSMHGVKLDLDRQLTLIEETLRPYLAEWNPPLSPPGDSLGFYVQNPFYGPLDSHVLYGLVRHFRPERVVEVGSGFSTLVIREAAEANGREDGAMAHVIVDPHPSYLVDRVRREVELVAEPPGEVDRSLFAELGDGDILFVDTTHTVKIGGEVVYLILELLPTLAPGVVVHFHDIFRPFEYPRTLYERFNKHWQEHYLLEAFLAHNPTFEVLCANHALARLHRERLTASIASLRAYVEPSAFWLRRTRPSSDP